MRMMPGSHLNFFFSRLTSVKSLFLFFQSFITRCGRCHVFSGRKLTYFFSILLQCIRFLSLSQAHAPTQFSIESARIETHKLNPVGFSNVQNSIIFPYSPTVQFSAHPRIYKSPKTVSPSVGSVAIPWMVVHQTALSMGFSRQEYWSGLPRLLQGNFPNQGSNPSLLRCRRILYSLSHQGSPQLSWGKFISWMLRRAMPDPDSCFSAGLEDLILCY